MNTALLDIEHEIIRTVTYFDVFSYPLTESQLYAFLPYRTATNNQFREALYRLTKKEILNFSNGYFYASTRADDIVALRLENERRALKMLRRARWVAFFLKQIPFVRAVFITGSLSKHVAPHKSDIDFMLITEFNRLWICKMILTGFRRFFLFNSKKYFCINLMVTENAVHFPVHNYYTAVEIATTRVLWNTDAFENYQKENVWMHEYLPHWQSWECGIRPLSRELSPLQRMSEKVLNIFNLDALNDRIMFAARKFWRKKHNDLDENKFNSIIQCTPDISSVWHDDHQGRIYDGFCRRLASYGMNEVR